MKKIRIKPSKFVRNILICIVLLLVAAFIIDIAPGYKRDEYENVVNLIINENNRTGDLIHNLYINENGTIYMSEQDIRNLFDKNLYYDEKSNQIITTSDTKVASISLNDRKIIINDSTQDILDMIIKIDDNLYLPISDMTIVYNIKISYIKNTNRVVIDELNKGMIKSTVSENTDIKFKPKGLSKDIGTLAEGQVVSCFYTTSTGWRNIRTEDGLVGYIKANKLSNEYIVRQDMKERGEAVIIPTSNYEKNTFEIEDKTGTSNKIAIAKLLDTNMETIMNYNINYSDSKKWIAINNTNMQDNTKLQDYETRAELINSIVIKAMDEETKGVIINWRNINDENMLVRFIIELAPRLRELGISTCIVTNDNLNQENYINVVDYIVK